MSLTRIQKHGSTSIKSQKDVKDFLDRSYEYYGPLAEAAKRVDTLLETKEGHTRETVAGLKEIMRAQQLGISGYLSKKGEFPAESTSSSSITFNPNHPDIIDLNKCRQLDFLHYILYFYIHLYYKIKKDPAHRNFIENELKINGKLLNIIIHEIWMIRNAYQIRKNYSEIIRENEEKLSKLSKEDIDKMSEYIRSVLNDILASTDGFEYCIPVGSPGHAVYLVLIYNKKNRSLTIRIDNASAVLPIVLKWENIIDPDIQKNVVSYITEVCLSKKQGYSHSPLNIVRYVDTFADKYKFKKIDDSDYPPLPTQTGPNCVWHGFCNRGQQYRFWQITQYGEADAYKKLSKIGESYMHGWVSKCMEEFHISIKPRSDFDEYGDMLASAILTDPSPFSIDSNNKNNKIEESVTVSRTPSLMSLFLEHTPNLLDDEESEEESNIKDKQDNKGITVLSKPVPSFLSSSSSSSQYARVSQVTPAPPSPNLMDGEADHEFQTPDMNNIKKRKQAKTAAPPLATSFSTSMKNSIEHREDQEEESQSTTTSTITQKSEEQISEKMIIAYAERNRKVHVKTDLSTHLNRHTLNCTNARLAGKHTDLSYAIFKKIVFIKALFDEANLKDTQFQGCDLTKASFRSANLSGIVLTGSDMYDAVFTHAKGLSYKSLVDARNIGDIQIDPSDEVNCDKISAALTIQGKDEQIRQLTAMTDTRAMNVKLVQEETLAKEKLKSESALSEIPKPENVHVNNITIPFDKKKKRKREDFISSIVGSASMELGSMLESNMSMDMKMSSSGLWDNEMYLPDDLHRTLKSTEVYDSSLHHKLMSEHGIYYTYESKSNLRAGIQMEYQLHLSRLQKIFSDLEEKENQLNTEFDSAIDNAKKKGLLGDRGIAYIYQNRDKVSTKEQFKLLLTTAFFECAVRHNQRSIVENILSSYKGISHSIIDRVISFTVSQGYIELTRILLKYRNPSISQTKEIEHWLALAIQNDHHDMVRLLLDNKASVSDYSYSYRSTTPLHIAAGNNRERIAKLLIERKASTDTKDSNGWIPLEIATYHGSIDVVRLLLPYATGFTDNARSSSTTTSSMSLRPGRRNALYSSGHSYGRRGSESEFDSELYLLNLAVRNGKEKVVKVLLDAKVSLKERDENDETPTLLAVKRNQPTIVKMLLDAKCSVNEVDDHKKTLLFNAVVEKDQPITEMLLEHKADINQGIERDSWLPKLPTGSTPLICAVFMRQMELVKMLVEKKADIDQSNASNLTPLYYAAQKGDLSIVTYLIAAKANVSSKAPLIGAVMSKNQEIVSLLLKEKADVNQVNEVGETPLIRAAQKAHLPLVKQLLEARASVSCKTTGEASEWRLLSTGSTAFLAAAGSHNDAIEVVKCLLEAKAEINEMNCKDESALCLAAWNNHKVASYLIEQKAEIGSQLNNPLTTPLLAAAYRGAIPIITRLLEQKADVNQSNVKGETPLFKAAGAYDGDATIDCLIAAKADVNAVTKQETSYPSYPPGSTALFVAAREGRVSVVKKLVESKASVNHCNAEGETPLIYAFEGYRSSMDAIVTLLVNARAEVNTQTRKGETPLLMAADKDSYSWVKLLLDNKAVPGQPNKEGKTPIYIAYHKHSPDIVDLLVSAKADPQYKTQKMPLTSLQEMETKVIEKSKEDLEQALKYHKTTIEINSIKYGTAHPIVAENYNDLGSIYYAMGDTKEAITCYDKALTMTLVLFGKKHQTVATIYNNLGRAYHALNDIDKALEYQKNALKIFIELKGEKHINVAECYHYLAELYQAQQNKEKAEEFYKKSINIYLQLNIQKKVDDLRKHLADLERQSVIVATYDSKPSDAGKQKQKSLATDNSLQDRKESKMKPTREGRGPRFDDARTNNSSVDVLGIFSPRKQGNRRLSIPTPPSNKSQYQPLIRRNRSQSR